MKEKKGIKISIILTLIGVVSLVTGITFAIYENTINAGKSQVIKTGIVNFTLTESTNGLVLDNLQELTDYEGMAQETFYEFSITNTGDTKTDYEIYLIDKNSASYTGTILDDKYVKVGLTINDSKEKIVNLEEVNRLIDKVTLNVGKTANYKLRVWLNFDGLTDEEKEALVGQKIFLTLKINGIQNIESIPIGTETLISQTDNLNESGLYTITHEADSTLQIGATESVTEYRYRGANPKNYVTFNNETWRIIGVFPTEDENGNIENRIKLIRNESIGTYSWDAGTTAYNYSKQDNLMLLQDDNKIKVKYLEEKDKYNIMMTIAEPVPPSLGENNWARPATLNTYLNGTYLSTLTSEAQSMISSSKYYLGGYNNYSQTSQDMYSYERKISGSDYYYSTNPNSWVGKIALMYESDYGYASLNCETKALYSSSGSSNDLRACNDTNWLYNIKETEWLLPQLSSSSSIAFFVSSDGYVYNLNHTCTNPFAVRPVVYLTSAVQIIGGEGTESNPYQLGV